MAFWNNNNDDDNRRRNEYGADANSGYGYDSGRRQPESNFDARYTRPIGGADGLRRRLEDLPPLSRQSNDLPPIQRAARYDVPPQQGQPIPQAAPIAPPPYVPPMNNGAGNVVITSPETYSDVQNLIDYLKMSRPLIIDFCKVNGESAQRILDFMSGAIYALSGSMQRISQTIFLLTPAGVSITIPVEQLKRCAEEQHQKKKK